VIHDIRRAFHLLDRADRWRWAALVPLAAIVAALEAIGAGAVFVLVRLMADPSHSDNLPAALRWLPRGGDRRTTFALAAAIAGFYLARNLVLVAIEYAQERVVQRSGARIAVRLLGRYLGAPYTFFFGRSGASLAHNVFEGTNIVVEGVLASIVHLASEVLVVAGLLALLAVTAPAETFAAVAVIVVVLGALLGITRRYYRRWGAEEHAIVERMLARLHHSFDAIKDIAVSGRQDYFASRFEADRLEFMRVKVRRGSATTAVRLGVETVFICAMLLAVMLMTASGRSGTEAVSILSLFAYAGFRVVPSANRIILNANSLRHGLGFVGALTADWAALEDTDEPASPAGAWPPLERDLVIDNVSFGYGEGRTHALDGINLTIARGESVGIVGPTGAGKSTLVDVMLGLLRPARGRVLADGRDIRDGLRAWQTQIGYVPQQVMLIDDTLRRNIAFGLDDDRIDEARVVEVVRTARLAPLVQSLPDGLNTRVGERGIRLSGGERQRIAIARSLYRDPAVLIFDEATSALDHQTEREIADAIDAVRGQRTVVVIAHRMTTVRNCDRLIVLDAGRVVAEGTFDALSTSSAAFRALSSGATG
jgi:ATP-binding cassette, subfamily B, bacterial PglK